MACFVRRFFNFLAVQEDEAILSFLIPIITKAAAHSHMPRNPIRDFRCAVGGVARTLLEYRKQPYVKAPFYKQRPHVRVPLYQTASNEGAIAQNDILKGAGAKYETPLYEGALVLTGLTPDALIRVQASGNVIRSRARRTPREVCAVLGLSVVAVAYLGAPTALVGCATCNVRRATCTVGEIASGFA